LEFRETPSAATYVKHARRERSYRFARAASLALPVSVVADFRVPPATILVGPDIRPARKGESRNRVRSTNGSNVLEGLEYHRFHRTIDDG